MMRRDYLMALLALSVGLSVTACDERKQDQLTPVSKTEGEGTDKAQDYPSTRNTENPDPSIGGTNSASTRPEAHPDAPATGSAPAPEQTTGR
jgi:hypothetical protein